MLSFTLFVTINNAGCLMEIYCLLAFLYSSFHLYGEVYAEKGKTVIKINTLIFHNVFTIEMLMRLYPHDMATEA